VQALLLELLQAITLAIKKGAVAELSQDTSQEHLHTTRSLQRH
jgi:hypothetical protein